METRPKAHRPTTPEEWLEEGETNSVSIHFPRDIWRHIIDSVKELNARTGKQLINCVIEGQPKIYDLVQVLQLPSCRRKIGNVVLWQVGGDSLFDAGSHSVIVKPAHTNVLLATGPCGDVPLNT